MFDYLKLIDFIKRKEKKDEIVTTLKSPIILLYGSCCCQTMQVIKDSEVRVACVQVLFSAVYHLKSMILPYSSELLKLSLKSLEGNSEKVLNPVPRN